MSQSLRSATGLWLLVLSTACASTPRPRPEPTRFYQNPSVRECLKFNQDRKTQQSQACWHKLQQRLQTDAVFAAAQELSASDRDKIDRMAAAAEQRLRDLRQEYNRCCHMVGERRDERERCLQEFRERHREELDVDQLFEVDAAIASVQEARARARGDIEDTLEHAGKLLGARLGPDEEGLRLERVLGAPLDSLSLAEEGLILLIDGEPVRSLVASEQISRLERCEERPVELLIRFGGRNEATFERIQVRCGREARAQLLARTAAPNQLCTLSEGDPEIRLGLSLCYRGAEGRLVVEQVCADGPAARAGVRPGQEFDRLNGEPLLGMEAQRLREALGAFPQGAVLFGGQGGALTAPAALAGPPLDPNQSRACWRAIESSRSADEPPAHQP